MRTRYLVIIGVALVVSAGWLLVRNQSHLNILVNQISAKDAAGESVAVDIEAANTYASKHMDISANLSLSGSYNRALAASHAPGATTTSGVIYNAAQAACSGRSDSIVQARCVTAYVASHGAPGANPQALTEPKIADYQHSFKGPSWSFDNVGLLILFGFGFLTAAILFSFKHKQ